MPPPSVSAGAAAPERVTAMGDARTAGGPAGGTARPVASCGRVLLVDDDPPVARAVQRTLERLGYEVTTCSSGPEALARFRACPARFDVVLTDEGLPVMPGHELTRELLAVRPGVPVIICTGYSEHLDEERAREIGAHALFLKPLDVAVLAGALRSAIAR